MPLSRITSPFMSATANVYSPSANTIAIRTASADRVTVDSNGNVGFGETSPAGSSGYTQLVVRGSSGAELSLKTGTTQYGYVYVDTGGFRIINPQSGAASGTLQFHTSNTERARFEANGVFNLSSGQLKFPASQSASSDPNTLDDYEEGTWTPNISSNNGSGTFTKKVGTYVKIGKQVTIWFVCDFGSSLAAGTTQYLGGLPFNVGSIESTTIVGSFGGNGPSDAVLNLMTLSGNRGVLYVYRGGGQETTTLTYAGGFATYWID